MPEKLNFKIFKIKVPFYWDFLDEKTVAKFKKYGKLFLSEKISPR